MTVIAACGTHWAFFVSCFILCTDLEAEAFDQVQVKMASTLSNVEALRASEVVLEKAKDLRDGGGILSAKYPRSFELVGEPTRSL